MGIPTAALAVLEERSGKRAFKAGSQLMRQGDVSDFMYVVVKGLIRVERTHPQVLEPVVLTELGPGEVVGEMGLLDGEPRSATVIAVEDTETVELSAGALAQLVLDFPEVSTALLTSLSRRLRSTDELCAQ